MWPHVELHPSCRQILLTHARRALTATELPIGNHWMSEYPAVARCINKCGRWINATSTAAFECHSPALYDRMGVSCLLPALPRPTGIFCQNRNLAVADASDRVWVGSRHSLDRTADGRFGALLENCCLSESDPNVAVHDEKSTAR